MRPRTLKYLRRISLAVLVAGLLAALAFCFPQQVLTVDDGPVTGDVLVLLGGGSNHHERAQYAAELYKAGAAHWVLCTGKGDCAANEEVLEKAGVPAAVILTEDKSANTSENARFSRPILHRVGAKRVIIVTSWFHSRRAWHVFHHYAPDLVLYSRPSRESYENFSWRRGSIRLHVFLEYLKLPEYLLRYGVSPV